MSESSLTNPTAACPARPDLPCDLGEPTPYPDRSGLVGDVAVVRCVYCGVGVTRPPLGDVAFLYEGRESQDFQPLTGGVARTIKTVAFRRDARKLLRQIGKTPKRVLDFGCGSGLFTRCLGDVLPGSIVVGSDFASDPPGELEDRPYLCNEKLFAKSAQFDLVMAMHVIEHDDDPSKLLQRLKSLGTPNCTFVFEVPNVDCVWAKTFGKSWDAWYLPFHRIHFTKSSLRGLLERNGFEVVQEIDASIPSMGRSIANLLGQQNSLPFLLAGAALHPVQLFVERMAKSPTALRLIARTQSQTRGSSSGKFAAAVHARV